MAILKRHRVPGMTKEQYDQVSSGAAEAQKVAPGFQAHYAVFDDGVLTVIEVWDSVDEHDTWYDNNIRPHIPADTPKPDLAELHNSRSRSAG